MSKDMNIIDDVLSSQDFSDEEKKKFKEMLNIVSNNKKYGFYKDLKNELKRIIEREDGADENKASSI